MLFTVTDEADDHSLPVETYNTLNFTSPLIHDAWFPFPESQAVLAGSNSSYTMHPGECTELHLYYNYNIFFVTLYCEIYGSMYYALYI